MIENRITNLGVTEGIGKGVQVPLLANGCAQPQSQSRTGGSKPSAPTFIDDWSAAEFALRYS